jgi:multidrug efflux pump subunit AcrA (membrane-fusion protein)
VAPIAQEKPKVESELDITTISKKAVLSLEIKTERTELKEEHEQLTMTGWIMAKPGNEVTLTAPAAGYVHWIKGQHVLIAGEPVKANEELLRLEPVLSPVEQIQVAALKRSIESDLIKGQQTLENAQVEYDRTVALLKKDVRTKQDVELALKALDHAKEDVAAAKAKLTFFQTQSVTLKTPQAGKILQLHVSPGQYVPVAAPLISIVDLRPIWIRVPVAEYDLPLIDPRASVSITWKNPSNHSTGQSTFFAATPVGRVAQVDPIKRTADLWYELVEILPASAASTVGLVGSPLGNGSLLAASALVARSTEFDRFVKDQMVTVNVPIGKKQKATVVPYSAIVFDAYGHTYIYLDRGPDKTGKKQQYLRRRIEMVTSVNDGLIIRPSLKDGELVVTHGAAALFSREFHKPPVQLGEDD